MAVTTGVIADDFTGATDIASFMAQQVARRASARYARYRAMLE